MTRPAFEAQLTPDTRGHENVRQRATAAARAGLALLALASALAFPPVSVCRAADDAASPDTSPGTGFGRRETFGALLPPQLVEAQSQTEYAQVLAAARQGGRLLPSDDARVERVRAVVTRLAPFATKWNDRVKDWQWEVNVVRAHDTLLVQCLPSGKIVVYSGLLDKLHLKDDELGLLLGHMIAHALREQVRQRLVGQQALGFGSENGGIAQLFGVTGLASAPASPLGTSILTLKFDATDETEADVIGGDIAARAGFDPRAALTLWDKLALASRADRTHGFISMHPYSAARRHDIAKRLPDMLALYAKARGTTIGALPDYAGMKAVVHREVSHH